MEDIKTNTFIEKARKVHGNLYSYSFTLYINSRTKVKIFCEKHGEFGWCRNCPALYKRQKKQFRKAGKRVESF